MTKRSYATELFPYSKTYSHFSLHQRQTKGKVLLQKLNTGPAGENNNDNNKNHIGENNNNNNIVSSLAHYSSWIINLYFKVIQVLFLLC